MSRQDINARIARTIRFALEYGSDDLVWDHECIELTAERGLMVWEELPTDPNPQDEADAIPYCRGTLTAKGHQWVKENVPHAMSYRLDPVNPSDKICGAEIGFVTEETAKRLAREVQDIMDKIDAGNRMRLSRKMRPVPMFNKKGLRFDTVE